MANKIVLQVSIILMLVGSLIFLGSGYMLLTSCTTGIRKDVIKLHKNTWIQGYSVDKDTVNLNLDSIYLELNPRIKNF